MLALHLSPICAQMHGCVLRCGRRLHKYIRTAMRFVAAPLAHMQMCMAAHFAYGCTHMCMAVRFVAGRSHMRIYAVVRFVLERPHMCRCTVVCFALERPHICRCTAARFVAEPLAHMQMHGCALRLGAPAHVQMHGYALRRWIARTYAYAWLCASTRNRSHICIHTAARSIAWRLHGRWRAHKSSTFR